MKDVDNVIDTFDAKVRQVAEAKAAYDKGIADLRAMLPAVRRALRESGLPLRESGPKAIERRTDGLISRETISNLTAEAMGTSRKPPGA